MCKCLPLNLSSIPSLVVPHPISSSMSNVILESLEYREIGDPTIYVAMQFDAPHCCLFTVTFFFFFPSFNRVSDQRELNSLLYIW